MKVFIFDDYETRMLDCSEGFEISWIWVPYVSNGTAVKYISSDLYDFLPIPDLWDPEADGQSFVKGTTCFLKVAAGGRCVLIRPRSGLDTGRDRTFSEELSQMMVDAVASGNPICRIDLNSIETEDLFEFVSETRVAEILRIAEEYKGPFTD